MERRIERIGLRLSKRSDILFEGEVRAGVVFLGVELSSAPPAVLVEEPQTDEPTPAR